ncbi:MAG TPA: hypothetical protein VEH04_15885 [Verrucomicrobiae bacterium]|nr:hypothetical protein [Verrucomicrobiae bacterium]
MSRFSDMAVLFHGLIGLCAGWLYGAQTGWVAGLIAAPLGCTAGLLAGFLISRTPQAFRLMVRNIPPKHRLLATVFALSSVGLGIAFWSACINCASQ